ncbi:Lactate utilization protein A [subsurface metagenome]
MGVQHDKNFINFNEWMLEKLNSGDIKIKENLNLNVTIHDNCFSKSLGGKYWDPPRKILEKCGCNIIEMKHIKDSSLCCGFGAGASWVKNFAIIFDIISEGAKKFKEAEETGANALISYCTGCLYLLWATKELLGSKIDIFHIIEVVRMAMGEKLEYPKAHIKRAWDIIAIMTYQLLVSIFQKNFYISRITYNKDKSTYQPKKYSLLRIMRFFFNISIVRKVYAKVFRFLMTLINTR